MEGTYRQTFNISRTKSPNVDVSRLALQLFLRNPLKPSVVREITKSSSTFSATDNDTHEWFYNKLHKLENSTIYIYIWIITVTSKWAR